MEYSGLSDGALLHLIAGHDQSAFREIYLRHWKSMYRQALKKVGGKQAAEECIHDVFIGLWKRRESAILIRELPPYLHIAVKYRVINYLKSDLLQVYTTDIITDLYNTQESTASKVDLRELRASVEHAVDRLPLKTREIFRLSRFSQCSNKEISSMLHISEKSVEYHISQSIKVLRLRLKEFIFFF